LSARAPDESTADRRPAAFFDLDRTLMAGSSAYHFGRAVYRAGRLSRRQLARDAIAQISFRLRGATDAAVAVLLERILDGIKGQSVKDLARLRADVLAGILPRIYPQMTAVVRDHQDAGRPCYIVSAASQEMVEALAIVMAMEGGIGTRSEIADGVYTGRLDGPFVYGEGKAEALRRCAEEQGIDLGRSWAYSDSASDLPMLRAVGHPVAVNPDAALEEVARQQGWEVLRFEKLGQWIRMLGGVLAGGVLAGAWALGRRSRQSATDRQARHRLRRAFPPSRLRT
jgi:HAD superfamily hydrolase (TIGR01490 family)